MTFFFAFVVFLLICDVFLPMPTLFFSATALRFSEDDISPQVFTVLLDTLLEGLHFLVFLFLRDPQTLPFSSVHFSLNQRLRANPFLVFLTATFV